MNEAFRKTPEGSVVEWTDSEPVAVEFYEPFVQAAQEQSAAQRRQKLDEQRKELNRGLASCQREIARWADVERRYRMRLDDVNHQLIALGEV